MLLQDTKFPRVIDDTDRFKDRNNSYLKPCSFESQKQTTEKFAVQLRKSHRVDQMQKRRSLLNLSRVSQLFSESFKGKIDISALPIALIQSYPELANEQTPALDKFLILRTILNESSAADLIVESLEALLGILYDCEEDTNKQVFFGMDFVQIFIKYMDWKYGSRVVLLASDCILNLSTSIAYYTGILLNNGAINALVRVVSCKSLGVSSLAVATLGNLCMDFKDRPELVDNPLIYNKINELMEENKEIHTDLYSNLLYYIKSLLINAPNLVGKQHLSMVVNWLEKIIVLEEGVIIQDALKVAHSLSLIDVSLIRSISIMNYLIKFYLHHSALKVILNITHDSDEAVKFFMKNFLPEKLNESLHSSNNDIRKTSFQILGNLLMSYNDPEIINSTISPSVCEGMLDNDPSVRLDAMRFMSNTCQYITIATWYKLIDNKLLEGLSKCLDTEETPEILNSSLFVVTHLLLCGRIESERKCLIGNEFVEKFENEGLYELIEFLMIHPNDEVSGFASDIIDEYFNEAASTDDYCKQGSSSFKFS